MKHFIQQGRVINYLVYKLVSRYTIFKQSKHSTVTLDGILLSRLNDTPALRWTDIDKALRSRSVGECQLAEGLQHQWSGRDPRSEDTSDSEQAQLGKDESNRIEMRDHAAKCVETFETSHGRGKRRLETTESDEEEYSSMSGEEKGVVPKLRERHRSDYKQQHTLGHGQLSPNQDTATGVPSVKSQQIKESNEGSMNIEMTAADDEYSQTSSNEISSHTTKRKRRESDLYAPKQRILHSAKYKAQERNHPKVGKGKRGRYLEHTTACLSEKQVWSNEEDTQQSPYTSSKSVRAETDPEEASFSSSEGEEESQHSGPETGGWKRASTRSEVRTTDRDSEKGHRKVYKGKARTKQTRPRISEHGTSDDQDHSSDVDTSPKRGRKQELKIRKRYSTISERKMQRSSCLLGKPRMSSAGRYRESSPTNSDSDSNSSTDKGQRTPPMESRKRRKTVGRAHVRQPVGKSTRPEDHIKHRKRSKGLRYESEREEEGFQVKMQQESSSSSMELANSSSESDLLSEIEKGQLRNVFKCFFGKLCCQIKDPVQTAAELQAKALLSCSTMENMFTSPESRQNKVITLVRALYKRIRAHPAKIFTVIEVFLHIRLLQTTGKEMLMHTGK